MHALHQLRGSTSVLSIPLHDYKTAREHKCALNISRAFSQSFILSKLLITLDVISLYNVILSERTTVYNRAGALKQRVARMTGCHSARLYTGGA